MRLQAAFGRRAVMTISIISSDVTQTVRPGTGVYLIGGTVTNSRAVR
jgi:hypothetical protein